MNGAVIPMRKSRELNVRLINRRSFVRNAGLLVASCGFLEELNACGYFVSEIPCIAPAPARVPIAGMTYIRASEIGCALDCDLTTGHSKHGGGPATDDAPRINAALASASKSNPLTLILDGSALISGLFLPEGGYWNIEGMGCETGFFIKTGTNNDGIHNGGPAAIPSDPGPPAPQRGRSVSLRSFVINGNRGTGKNGDSTTGSPQGITAEQPNLWYYSINLMNLDNIDVENVVVVNSPAYCIRLSNVGQVVVSGCVFRSQGWNTDGVHFDGPANDITISDCDFVTGDDPIALNCPEGYSGDISRVTVESCTFQSPSYLMRLYSTNAATGTKFNIDTVTVRNCHGRFAWGGFLLAEGSDANPGSITALTISDCNLTSPAILELGVNFGNITITNVTLNPLDSYQTPGFALARSSRPSAGYTYSGTSISINDCTIARSSDIFASAVLLANNSSIGTLTFNGFVVRDAGHYRKVPELINIMSGSVNDCVINAVSAGNISAPASSQGFLRVGIVRGSGVLATGWEFPDAVMADGVPYISASTGLPSIKIGGVVEPYPTS